MSIDVDLSEVRAFSSRLSTVGIRLGATHSAVFRKTVHDIQADAQALAPVDTGALRNSVTSTITGDGRSGAMVAEIGPTVDYGVHQEYGTSTQPGTPFMGPAFDRRVPGYAEALAILAEQAI